jgi:hypothetical protein
MPLPGSDKYRKVADQGSTAVTDVEKANEAVDVLPLLWALGCEIPAEVERSVKFKCPYSAEHPDGGVEKAARFYGATRSAYCFAGHGVLTPVKLIADDEGLTWDQAADKILRERGLKEKPKTYQERFTELREKSTVTASLDTSYSITALRTWLTSEYPEYGKRQYDDDVRDGFMRCVDALNSKADPTVDELREWLTVAKKVMKKVMDHG